MHVRANHASGSATAVARCVCRTRAKAEEEKQHPGGFLPFGEIAMSGVARAVEEARERIEALGDPDREIARIIIERRGKAHAVSIGEICKLMWPSAWYGGGSADAAELHRRRNLLARTVKSSVERIRSEARLPIAATKGSPGGYYIPVTAEECDECYRRLFGEGVKLILLSRLFRPEADIVAELRGQLRLVNHE
jgi:hypothetical protein